MFIEMSTLACIDLVLEIELDNQISSEIFFINFLYEFIINQRNDNVLLLIEMKKIEISVSISEQQGDDGCSIFKIHPCL